jgi:hypothetical protein
LACVERAHAYPPIWTNSAPARLSRVAVQN